MPGGYGIFAAMSTLEIAIPVNAMSMAEVRPALEAALQRQFPGGLLQQLQGLSCRCGLSRRYGLSR